MSPCTHNKRQVIMTSGACALNLRSFPPICLLILCLSAGRKLPHKADRRVNRREEAEAVSASAGRGRQELEIFKNFWGFGFEGPAGGCCNSWVLIGCLWGFAVLQIPNPKLPPSTPKCQEEDIKLAALVFPFRCFWSELGVENSTHDQACLMSRNELQELAQVPPM